MSPIIRLRDTATTTCLDEETSSTSSTSSKQLTQPQAPRKANEPTMNDFLHYVGSLMVPRTNTPLTGQSLGVPFVQALPTPIRPSMSEEITSKDAIEATILRSGYSQGGRGGLFEIARNGRRVASVTLSRPAYKLGETITAVINFNNAEIPCYHIHSSLETSESVDPTLALRSPASIHRATRRIHSHHFESTIFSKRVTLTPTIPATASPEFSTSGISVAWHLRIEFITPVLDMGEQFKNEELLELTSNDSRGEIWEARQGLYVESFDAAIPVKVYPNPSEMGFAGGQPPVTGFVV
jgi:RAB6A-GEF complex partner protein 2